MVPLALLNRPRTMIVTDTHVAAAQLPRLDASLRRANIVIEPIILPAGEQTKSFEGLADVSDRLLALELAPGALEGADGVIRGSGRRLVADRRAA